jgi:hypothetical protein
MLSSIRASEADVRDLSVDENAGYGGRITRWQRRGRLIVDFSSSLLAE